MNIKLIGVEKMDRFEAMRRLATTLGVSAPESSDDIYNVNFINSINRSAKRVFKDMSRLNDKNKMMLTTLDEIKNLPSSRMDEGSSMAYIAIKNNKST